MTSHKLSDITLYPIGYVREHLSSYYLLGNNFKININNLDSSELEIKTTIKKTIEQLNEIGGIPNFFGYQRFGTIRPITHLVGKAIIKDDFKKAILTYLVNCSELENPYSREARKDLARTQDFKKSLHKFPKQLRFERLILNHLSKKPNDFIGAFKRLPFKLQMLFIQAYQSYLYNLFLSKRIEQGFSFKKAIIGDFAVNIDRSGLPMPQTGKLVNIENIEKINKSIKLEKMCIALPLVGFKQGFSSGKIGEMQKNIFEIEGITPENFRVKIIPRISGRGNLRAINIPLKKFKLKKVFSESNRFKNRININFMLHKGSYATILLREILKPLDPVKAGF
ncbi:tRNA pseudouridine(13) synthase TruD [Candidatus Bathyarchaeota archaeon]|nr:tRNA pseudouridine(13) synthase TruD [Candidatus Bathyarchaeota archaeon]